MTCDPALFQVTYWLVHDVGLLFQVTYWLVHDVWLFAVSGDWCGGGGPPGHDHQHIQSDRRSQQEDYSTETWRGRGNHSFGMGIERKACTVCKHHFWGLTMLIPPTFPSPKAVTAKWWVMLVRIGVPFTTTLNRVTIVSYKVYLNLLNTWTDLSHHLQQERNVFKHSRRINTATLKCSQGSCWI